MSKKKKIIVLKKKDDRLESPLVSNGLRDYQQAIVDEVFSHDDNVLVVLPTGGGKEQPLSSKILTKNGYILMGDVKIGDRILDGLGKECTVTGVFPQGLKQVYKIVFSDESFIRVGKEHINRFIRHAKTRYKKSYDGKTVKLDLTTSELIEQFNRGRYNFWCQLPVCELNEDSELEFDPYLLGFLIGDGSLAHSHKKISIGEKDILDKLKDKINDYNCHLVYEKGVDYGITRNDSSKPNAIKQFIDDNGLNVKSTEKHIPHEYLFASVKQRTELLQGLFDSDGYVSKKKCKNNSECCTFEWSTSSEKLSEDFAFLVRSLGCADKIAVKQPHYVYNGEKREGKISYRHFIKVPNDLQICTSEKHLSKMRKREHDPMRKIVNICEDGFEECQCIMVDSPDHTYITDNVTVTHNTVIAKEIIRNLKERVLFIVPKLELIRQSSATFGCETDIIWSSHTSLNGNHIIVASKQTLAYRDLSKIFKDEEISVIVDEVHIGLQSLKKCLSGVKVRRIIGLTATPERMDGSSFVLEEYCKIKLTKKSKYDYAVFNRVIDKWSIQELQKLGWLSPLHVILNPDAEKLVNVRTKHTYDDELDSDTIRDNMGDSFFRFIDKAREFKGKPTIIFTPDLKTLDVIEETLRKSNLNYKHVDGSMPVEERKVILDELENGKIDGVVNCGVLTTGFDMPKVKQCILIRHIKSRPLLFQIVGRFIRPYNGETAEIYDFAGSCYNFATASVPNVFESPVQWQYEGFDTKEKKKKDEDERRETEELKECLDDVNVTWTDYLNDPVKTLLGSLLFYKESFEEQLMNKSREVGKEIAQQIAGKQVMELKAAFNVEVNRNVQKQVSKLKNEMLLDKQKLIEEEVKRRLTLTPGALRSWFANNGFEWFRHYYPLILRHYRYNHSQEFMSAKMEFDSIGDNRRKMDEFYRIHGDLLKLLDNIKESTIRKIPIDGLEEKLKSDRNLADIFEDLYDERTNWWLSNFLLDGGPRSTQSNVVQQPVVLNTIQGLAASALV